LKHMAELQQSVVTDQETRHQIQTQILQWEENLERLHCEQFRLRCYMASLQSGELPNPKVSYGPKTTVDQCPQIQTVREISQMQLMAEALPAGGFIIHPERAQLLG